MKYNYYNICQQCMGKQNTLKAVTVLVLVGLISYVVWDNTQQVQTVRQRLLQGLTYQTSTTRTDNLAKYCPATVDRTSLATPTDLSTAKSNRQEVSTQLGIDGNKLINQLARGNTGDVLSTITSNSKNIGIYIGVFLLPFVVFLIAWPFLCCCCCCPSCCPSKCCQKPQNDPYTKCQLYWPAVTLILAILFTSSISIYGFVNASDVGPSFNNMGCSLAIFTDDLLNGNVTLDGQSYFTGLNIFKSKLTNLDSNLNFIDSKLTDLKDSSSGNTYSYVQAIQTVNSNDVKIIPDNAGTANMALTYDTPINSGSASNTLISSFSSVLGKWDSSNTLMSNLYNSIDFARYSMQAIKTSSYNFSSQISTIHSQIGPMETTIGSLATNVQDMDKQFGTLLSILKTPGDYGNTAIRGFYGFLTCFSFFTLIGALLTVCCDKPGCRHLMYFSCIFLFIGAFLTFIIAVSFSMFVPLFTWSCEYLNVALASDVGFKENFGAFLSNKTTSQISVCMPYGDGRIVSTVGGTAADGLNNLTDVITSLKSFNVTKLQTYITGNLTAITNAINSYANGDISDLDTANNQILRAFSDPTNSTNKVNCNTAFSGDSWVPSNNQDYKYVTAISCKSSSGTVGNIASCNSVDLTNAGGNTCGGCMDTTQLLAQYTAVGDVTNALNSKYSPTCAFNSILSNSWTNYFRKKAQTLGKPSVYTQISGSVSYRLQQATPKINGGGASTVFTNINNFRYVLDTVNGNLTTVSDLTDPTYGMLAGLNCRLFGEDFVTFQNIICGSFYNNMFIIRLTFGMISWGLLFTMFCIVCTGVRQFKHINKMRKIKDQGDESSLVRITKQKE